jgi:hypothetical protein
VRKDVSSGPSDVSGCTRGALGAFLRVHFVSVMHVHIKLNKDSGSVFLKLRDEDRKTTFASAYMHESKSKFRRDHYKNSFHEQDRIALENRRMTGKSFMARQPICLN